MKTFRKLFLLLILSILFLSSAAASSAFAAESTEKKLGFKLSSYKYEDDKLTLVLYFTNLTDDRDIYDLRDAVVTVTDKNGQEISSIECHSDYLDEVRLNPGEKWKYTLIRNIDGLSDSGFSLSSITADCSYGYSSKSHKSSDCTTCSDWDERDYKSTDTGLSKSLTSKLKTALSTEEETSSSSSGSSSSSSGTTIKSTCSKCNGTGKITCVTCDGVGYKEITKYKNCLVTHHLDCPKYKNSSAKCDGCHARNDKYTQKQKCGVCMGKKTITCTRCSGTGKAY